MTEEYYFALKELTVGYDQKPLIKDITVELKRGELLTLIGPNGSGKSTILKSIAGQLSLLAGTVFLDGQVLPETADRERARRIAAVLTDPVQAPQMTCRDMVAMGRYPYTGHFGILGKEDLKIVDEAMELADVAGLWDRQFGKISDGQRQRVLLARALCQQPEVLILDEPTSFLDIRYKLEFLSVLKNMQSKQKVTVILSLHEPQTARCISDKILCVSGEYIRKMGTPDEVFTPDTIRELYGMTEQQYEQAGELGLI